LRKLRWSASAADDLERIRQHIQKENQEAARKTVKTLYEGILALKRFPHLGRPGREEGKRELAFTPLPYIVVYRVTGTHIEISRIWHGAQVKH
jgi:toxin ParE1/3/4